MVLQVKDYVWSQSNEFVYINVPLKGKSKKDIDIITTDSYIKVNFVPYIFECFLFEPIDDLNSKVVFIDGILMFSLRKINETLWSHLNNIACEDKSTAKIQRLLEMEKYESQTSKIEKEKSEQKIEGNKYSLRQMMDLESQEKGRIKNIKETETRKAMEELEEWKKSQIKSISTSDERKIYQQNSKKNDEEKSLQKTSTRKSIGQLNKQEIFDNDSNNEPERNIEPIRKPCKIQVSFTPRIFPTPERESVKQQEDEWLQKQLSIKQQNTIKVTADMKPEENNPEWLKNKGKKYHFSGKKLASKYSLLGLFIAYGKYEDLMSNLFAAGDYGGALAAYTLGLEINPNLHEFYSNRAACHIKMRNFFKSVEDASKALELLNPPVAQNLISRIKAHLRRGAAFCNLQMYKEGLLDYEAALKLDPGNQSIIKDIERLKAI